MWLINKTKVFSVKLIQTTRISEHLTHSFIFSYNYLISQVLILLIVLCGFPPYLLAQDYGLRIFQINSGLYPFVQVYFRTFGENQRPLVNLNERNIGLMVKGRAYDPEKSQYFIQPIHQRDEAIRSVIVLDASESMAGALFQAALRASARYIDSKRPQDEIGVLAIRDTREGYGYEVVSQFERDPSALARRIVDIRANGQNTRLYDSIAYAMQMCGMASQGALRPSPQNYIVSCAIVIFSNGYDKGSALSREELNARIIKLPIPIPIYAVAYARKDEQRYFINLESVSLNSFGVYYRIGDAYPRMTRVVEEIQNIIQNDYVVTFRSYIPVDGEEHIINLGVEYPSGSGQYFYESTRFQAIDPPLPLLNRNPEIARLIERLNNQIPVHPRGPHFEPNQTGNPNQ